MSAAWSYMSISLLMFKILKFVLMLRINYSWYLDLHIRWFIMCMQTILAVPKVAWVNLLSLTWVNAASWPCFHHLAFWCFVLLPGATVFFLTHLYLLAFAFESYWLHKQMPAQGAHVPAMEKNKPKENCWACHLLSWQEQDINFCKGSCSKKPVPQAWQEPRGNKGFMGI